MLRSKEARGELHGCKVARGEPTSSHLFFADDSFLFCKDTMTECWVLKNALENFKVAYG